MFCRAKHQLQLRNTVGHLIDGKKWTASKADLEAFPVKPMQVALYLSFLISKSKTSTPVEEAVNVLSWVYQVAVVEEPTDHPLVEQLVAGAKRIVSTVLQSKAPATIKKYSGAFVSLLRQRFCTSWWRKPSMTSGITCS